MSTLSEPMVPMAAADTKKRTDRSICVVRRDSSFGTPPPLATRGKRNATDCQRVCIVVGQGCTKHAEEATRNAFFVAGDSLGTGLAMCTISDC